MNQENTQLATVNNITNMAPGTMVTSFKPNPEDRETSAKIFNALNNPSNRVSDCINQVIEVTDFLIEMTEIANQDTGEISVVPRVVLVDSEGETYQAVSFGMANVIRNVTATCGKAPWNPPVKLLIKQRSTKNGSMLTADMQF